MNATNQTISSRCRMPVEFCMSPYGDHNKILKAIVSFVSIYMVNVFTSLERSSEVFLHYKTMFLDITFSNTNHNIAVSDTPTPFPSWLFFLRKMHLPSKGSTTFRAILSELSKCFASDFKAFGAVRTN